MWSGNMTYNKCLMWKHKGNIKMFQNPMELIFTFVSHIIKLGKLCPQVCLFKKLPFAVKELMYFYRLGRVIEWCDWKSHEGTVQYVIAGISNWICDNEFLIEFVTMILIKARYLHHLLLSLEITSSMGFGSLVANLGVYQILGRISVKRLVLYSWHFWALH